MPIPRRVVLDACVLYPPSLRDRLLTLAALDAYDVVWSETILAEVERNVLADHPDIDPTRFRLHTIGAMRAAFPAALVEPRPDEELDVAGVDPGDRHVVGAALAAGADAIVTINVRHFPKANLSPAGISVVTPGALVTALDDTEPSLIDQALEHMSGRWKNPPRTVDAILELVVVHPTMAPATERIRRRRQS
jgi:predicted nucleic acid-binding protein